MKQDNLSLSKMNAPINEITLTLDSKKITLTERETECIKYMLSGMSAKQTAKAMNISPRTVEAYIVNVKNKFSCQKITYLFYKLSKLGLI